MGKRKRKYEIRIPLTVKGGIRAQFGRVGVHRASKQGRRVWWSRRWTDTLESFRIGARLGRGRNYAVSGQVSDLQIEPGLVQATVQGTEGVPYHGYIRFRLPEGKTREAIVQALREQPMLIARLLVNELPFEIEELFDSFKAPLFPSLKNDVWSHCSCPDYANPCKHLAAVYYLLGEAVSQQPVRLLELRGIPLSDLVTDAPPAVADSVSAENSSEEDSVSDFFGKEFVPFPVCGDPIPSASETGALLARLGVLPFWRGEERFAETISHVYARAMPKGVTAWTGERLDLRREDQKVMIVGYALHENSRRLKVDFSWFE